MTPNELQKFRKDYGLTVRDLAELTFSSVWTVYKWESGERNIPRVKQAILSRLKGKNR